MTFQGDSEITPDPANPPRCSKWFPSRALSDIIAGSPKPDSRDPEAENWES